MKKKFSVFSNTIATGLSETTCYVMGEKDEDNIVLVNYNAIGKGYGKIGNNDLTNSHILFFMFPDRKAYPLGYFKTKLHRDVAYSYVMVANKFKSTVAIQKSTFMGRLPIEDILIDILANNVSLESLVENISNETIQSAIGRYNKPWLVSYRLVREACNQIPLGWTMAQIKAFYCFLAMVVESPFEEWNSMDVVYSLFHKNNGIHY